MTINDEILRLEFYASKQRFNHKSISHDNVIILLEIVKSIKGLLF
jgi:hypothetical protein